MQINRKTIISIAITLGFLLVILIGFAIFTLSNRSGKAAVVIAIVPSDAQISVNGKSAKTGDQYLEPGKYRLTGQKKGYESATTQYIITEKTSNQALTLTLIPISDEAKKEADKNRAAYQELEALAGKSANDTGEAFRDKNPIVSELPFSNLLYTIGYRTDPKDPSGQSIIIEIDANNGYRQSALYQIEQWGYNLADYKINFRNYLNPFTPADQRSEKQSLTQDELDAIGIPENDDLGE